MTLTASLASYIEECDADISAITAWCEEIYDKKFSRYFQNIVSLRSRLESKSRSITDEELEAILTSVPIDLFSVAEVLNQFRLSQEVVKLKVKADEKSDTDHDSMDHILAGKILQASYASVISRVESEISFSRELIMGAKKIWDGRRKAEESNPVNEHTYNKSSVHKYEDLPNFSSRLGKDPVY